MASGEAETSSTTGAPLASDDINRTYAVEKVRAAATATVEASIPLLCRLLSEAEMLDKDEKTRLATITTSPESMNKTLMGLLRHRTLRDRAARVIVGSRRDAAAVDEALADGRSGVEVAAASDGRDLAMYRALKSDSTLLIALSRAFFAHHDRRSTRRRRGVNSIKITSAFFGLILLDFVLSNL